MMQPVLEWSWRKSPMRSPVMSLVVVTLTTATARLKSPRSLRAEARMPSRHRYQRLSLGPRLCLCLSQYP